MASFLLVHGSWHGAWCWDRLVPLLRGDGHDVLAVDLPAHGADRTASWLATLRGYGTRVADAARALPGRPFAVGHSMGGLAITQAAAAEPEAFAGLVYLCAFVPQPGDSMFALARSDLDSLVPHSTHLSVAGVRVRAECAREVFYASCSDADAAWATGRLRPDPVRPLLRRLRRGPPERLPRAYIACTRDRAISLGRQREMAARASIHRVITMDTDHSPFLSAPRELASHLGELAAAAPASASD
jgi:pimeloyl-ACP methyl ester carboxylesterase